MRSDARDREASSRGGETGGAAGLRLFMALSTASLAAYGLSSDGVRRAAALAAELAARLLEMVG